MCQNRAHENYKKVENLKLMRGRSLDVITAACLFIACKQEGKPRTIKGTHPPSPTHPRVTHLVRFGIQHLH